MLLCLDFVVLDIVSLFPTWENENSQYTPFLVLQVHVSFQYIQTFCPRQFPSQASVFVPSVRCIC